MEVICVDTDILIEYKRGKQKSETKFYKLNSKYNFAITTVTVFELLRGDDSEEDKFWEAIFLNSEILQLDIEGAKIAGGIYRDLKKKGQMVGVEDMLIAAIAMRNKMKIATNNEKHFRLIDVDII